MAHATDFNQDDHPTSSPANTPLAKIQKQLPLRVLSEEEFAHW